MCVVGTASLQAKITTKCQSSLNQSVQPDSPVLGQGSVNQGMIKGVVGTSANQGVQSTRGVTREVEDGQDVGGQRSERWKWFSCWKVKSQQNIRTQDLYKRLGHCVHSNSTCHFCVTEFCVFQTNPKQTILKRSSCCHLSLYMTCLTKKEHAVLT